MIEKDSRKYLDVPPRERLETPEFVPCRVINYPQGNRVFHFPTMENYEKSFESKGGAKLTLSMLGLKKGIQVRGKKGV